MDEISSFKSSKENVHFVRYLVFVFYTDSFFLLFVTSYHLYSKPHFFSHLSTDIQFHSSKYLFLTQEILHFRVYPRRIVWKAVNLFHRYTKFFTKSDISTNYICCFINICTWFYKDIPVRAVHTSFQHVYRVGIPFLYLNSFSLLAPRFVSTQGKQLQHAVVWAAKRWRSSDAVYFCYVTVAEIKCSVFPCWNIHNLMNVRKRCVEPAFIKVTRDNNRHIWGLFLKFMNVIWQYTTRTIHS